LSPSPNGLINISSSLLETIPNLNSSSQTSLKIIQNQTNLEFQATVFNADEVLLYLAGSILKSPIYLGKAIYQGDGVWDYAIDLNHRPLPNGNYKVYARITQNNAIFNSESVDLAINIPIPFNTDQFATIKKNVQDAVSQITINNQTISQNIQKTFTTLKIKISADISCENITQIADLVQNLQQLNNNLSQAILERQKLMD